MVDIQDLARRLAQAERSCLPIAPFTDEIELTEAEAYAVQAESLRLRGEPVVGYKLGFTSQVMREQMGIAAPNYGFLLRSMCLDADILDCSRQIHPRIEPEIALITDRELRGPGLTAAEVFRALGWVCPAFEVVDSRYREFRFRAPDNIADNSSASRCRLGRLQPVGGLGLRSTGVLLYKDGRLIDSGVGANALGDPVEAVRWLANRLGEEGRPLAAGSLVLTGGLTRAWPINPGETAVADFGLLGWVQLHAE